MSSQPPKAKDNEFGYGYVGYGYVGHHVSSDSPAKALYRHYLGDDTQNDYCTLATFVEDYPTSTARIPLAIVDDRLRERAGVGKGSANVYAIEALNNGLSFVAGFGCYVAAAISCGPGNCKRG